jgi:hypothetical protein
LVTEALPRYSFVESAVRDTIDKEGGLEKQGKALTQRKAFLNMAIRLEEARMGHLMPYISERDLICFTAYSKALGLSTAYEEAYIREVSRVRDVVLVMMMPTIKFTPDEYRPNDTVFQKSWQEATEDLVQKYGYLYRHVYIMNEVELDSRVEKIVELVHANA